MFLNIIFALFLLMIARIAWRIHKENEAQRILDILEGKYEEKEKGGMPMEHSNGRYKW